MTDIARKAFTAHEFKLDAAGAVSVAFAQLNVIDSDMDVTVPGAFPPKSVPMSAYGHSSWDGEMPIGKGSITENGEWGVFDGQFLMETDQGRNAYHTVKAMADLQEWSYGYNALDYSYGLQDGQSVRFLKSLDVFEVSPVLRGAGLGTHTLAIKSGAPGSDAPTAEQLSWYSEKLPALLDRIKSHAAARATEGRKLSRSDGAALDDLIESLEVGLAKAHDILTVPESPEAIKRRSAEIAVLVETARLNGIAV